MNNNKSAGSSTKATSIFANLSPHRYQQLSQHQFDEMPNNETYFLKVKNQQLQTATIRLAERILQLQQSNEQLLKINQRYIAALNQQFTHTHEQFGQHMKKVKNHPFCKHCNRAVLNEFQKDYRNLVKYTFILKDEIESKNSELAEYHQMKKELSQTNHTQPSTLIKELVEITTQAKQLKKELNRVQFEAQKFKTEAEKVKKNSRASKQATNQLEQQVQKYKSLINTIQNQRIDRQRLLNQKIYEQQLLIQNLEQNMRQAETDKNVAKHYQEELRKYSQIVQPKQNYWLKQNTAYLSRQIGVVYKTKVEEVVSQRFDVYVSSHNILLINKQETKTIKIIKFTYSIS